jgi:hypothetical protein
MQRRNSTLAVALLATLAACSSETVSPSNDTAPTPSFATSSTGAVVITEADITRQAEDTPPLDNWVLYTRLAGNGTFRVGPGNPPEGVGSLELVTPNPLGTDKVTLFNFDYNSTPISAFTALGYHTYQSSALVPIQLPSINLTIDMNGGAFVAGDFATLVFEPVYNLAQGPVLPNVWQDWDAIFGGQALWWVTRDVPGIGLRGATATWTAIKAALPNATILGGIGINQGTGSPALTASVDAFVVGVSGNTTTYDFEPFVTASNKGDCKDGGWQNARRSDGSRFKNQGDCVSYTNKGR